METISESTAISEIPLPFVFTRPTLTDNNFKVKDKQPENIDPSRLRSEKVVRFLEFFRHLR